jgi:hypothetical protein
MAATEERIEELIRISEEIAEIWDDANINPVEARVILQILEALVQEGETRFLRPLRDTIRVSDKPLFDDH